jgi:hypothetical protein
MDSNGSTNLLTFWLLFLKGQGSLGRSFSNGSPSGTKLQDPYVNIMSSVIM